MTTNTSVPGPDTRLKISLLVFAVVALLFYIVLHVDYAVDVSLKFPAPVNEDFQVLYHQNELSYLLSVKVFHVEGDHLNFSLPASTMRFNVYRSQQREIMRNGTVDQGYVSQIDLNGKPIEAARIYEAMNQEKSKARLGHVAKSLMLGFGCGLLMYAGYNISIREFFTRAIWVLKENPFSICITKLCANHYFKAFFLLCFSAGVLVWRRPGQVSHPYIFLDEAIYILPDYAAHGFASLFNTLNGYYVTVSKILALLAFKISFWHYPELAALMANLFILGVIFAIAYSPTHLKAPFLCAVMALLIKTGSECFGVVLYAFWWAGLLLALTVLWKNDQRPWLRGFFILLGGLSSPLIMAVAPLLIFRAFFERNRHTVISAIVAFIPFVIQGIMILRIPPSNQSLWDAFFYGLRIYVGSYTILHSNAYWTLLCAGLIFTILCVWFGFKWDQRKIIPFIKNNLYFLLLLGLLAAGIYASIARISVSPRIDWTHLNSHPLNVFRSRYFFYPFVFLVWTHVWVLISLNSKFPQAVVKVLMVLILFNFIWGGGYRAMPTPTPKLSWRGEIASIIKGDKDYLIYIENEMKVNHIKLDSEDCIKMIEKSFFFNDVKTVTAQ